MPKFLSYKAQFFIISAVIAVAGLFAIQRYLESYGKVNLPKPLPNQELHFFKNVYKKLNKTAYLYSCPDRERNLRELSLYSEERAAARGWWLDIDLEDPCIGGNLVETDFKIELNFTSPRFHRYAEIKPKI